MAEKGGSGGVIFKDSLSLSLSLFMWRHRQPDFMEAPPLPTLGKEKARRGEEEERGPTSDDSGSRTGKEGGIRHWRCQLLLLLKGCAEYRPLL